MRSVTPNPVLFGLAFPIIVVLSCGRSGSSRNVDGTASDAKVEIVDAASSADWIVDEQDAGPATTQDSGFDSDANWGADSPDAPEAAADGSTYCIGEVPTAPSFSPSPSLSKATGELWRKMLPLVAHEGDVALSGDRLAVHGGNLTYLLDTNGNIVAQLIDKNASVASPAIADTAGNFYLVGTKALSYTNQGTFRWEASLGVNLDPSQATLASSRVLLSPANILYFAATDGFLYGIKANDGSKVLTKSVGLGAGNHVRYLTLGVGDTLFVSGEPHRVSNGEFGPQPVVNGKQVVAHLATYSGLVAGWVGSGGVANEYVLDWCLKPKWALPNNGGWWGAYLVSVSGELLVLHGAGDQQVAFWYSSEGQVVNGPKSYRGSPAAIGADETIYSVDCSAVKLEEAKMRIAAHTKDFDPLWSIDFDAPCTATGLTLANDGVMYVARPLTNGTEVIAIQTRSPGLARTAVPTRLNDSRRTGWLSP